MPAGFLMPHSLLRIRIQLHPSSCWMANTKYHGLPPVQQEDNEMSIASDLLQQHIQTLVDDNARWQTLTTFCGNSPMRLAIRRNCRGGRKRSVTQHGASVLWRTSASFTSRCYALVDPRQSVTLGLVTVFDFLA